MPEVPVTSGGSFVCPPIGFKSLYDCAAVHVCNITHMLRCVNVPTDLRLCSDGASGRKRCIVLEQALQCGERPRGEASRAGELWCFPSGAARSGTVQLCRFGFDGILQPMGNRRPASWGSGWRTRFKNGFEHAC